ncbi:MAG TPA: FAD-binding protein [Burkholderiales bacterium]|nr:FAD-binding protein [Burkholderiales bacterium]
MPATLSHPLSAHELQEAMRNAQPIEAARLDRVLRVEPGQGVVEVQANTTWKSIAARLRPRDAQASAVRTTTPTVGESLARNAAGPDGRPTVMHVEALTLVTPDGELRRVNRRTHPELFALSVGGQGLFGALYSVTLKLDSLARAVIEAARSVPGSGSGMQLLLPPERVQAFVADAQARFTEWRIAMQDPTVRHVLQEDETFLRWAHQEYAEVSMLVPEPRTIGASVRTTQLRRSLIDAAIAHGGAFPIACTPEATRAQTEACYPQLKAFLAQKRRFDPAERIVNPWYRHYCSLLGRESCDVRWSR